VIATTHWDEKIPWVGDEVGGLGFERVRVKLLGK
jgi:hypothetical protein